MKNKLKTESTIQVSLVTRCVHLPIRYFSVRRWWPWVKSRTLGLVRADSSSGLLQQSGTWGQHQVRHGGGRSLRLRKFCQHLLHEFRASVSACYPYSCQVLYRMLQVQKGKQAERRVTQEQWRLHRLDRSFRPATSERLGRRIPTAEAGRLQGYAFRVISSVPWHSAAWLSGVLGAAPWHVARRTEGRI